MWMSVCVWVWASCWTLSCTANNMTWMCTFCKLFQTHMHKTQKSFTATVQPCTGPIWFGSVRFGKSTLHTFSYWVKSKTQMSLYTYRRMNVSTHHTTESNVRTTTDCYQPFSWTRRSVRLIRMNVRDVYFASSYVRTLLKFVCKATRLKCVLTTVEAFEYMNYKKKK